MVLMAALFWWCVTYSTAGSVTAGEYDYAERFADPVREMLDRGEFGLDVNDLMGEGEERRREEGEERPTSSGSSNWNGFNRVSRYRSKTVNFDLQ